MKFCIMETNWQYNDETYDAYGYTKNLRLFDSLEEAKKEITELNKKHIRSSINGQYWESLNGYSWDGAARFFEGEGEELLVERARACGENPRDYDFDWSLLKLSEEDIQVLAENMTGFYEVVNVDG